MEWTWKKFDELSGKEVYEILSVRQEVFIVEQNCAYLDADQYDTTALHLICRDDKRSIAAYCRLLLPGAKSKQPSLGRVLVQKQHRKKGLAKKCVLMAQDKSKSSFHTANLRISAQYYLRKFYEELGFEVVGDQYDDDGIAHIDMLFAEGK